MCDCRLCQRSREFRIRLQCVPSESQEYFEDIFDQLHDAEFDNEYFKALLKGQWPSAEDILEQALNKIREDKKNVGLD